MTPPPEETDVSPYVSDGLAPVCGRDPRVLILGSFPSRKSLLHTEYYGNPQNQFWKIMEALFSIDASLPYARRLELVQENHLALWDVVGSCFRPGSSDASITSPRFNDIAGFIAVHPSLRLIALNGGTAARFYAKMGKNTLPFRVMPSTSPAHARLTLKEKIDRWSAIKEEISG
jgi:TDG/mug DNA glycosylase family protein